MNYERTVDYRGLNNCQYFDAMFPIYLKYDIPQLYLKLMLLILFC